MRPGCIILNQSGRLPTEYGPLKCQTPKYCQTNTCGEEGFVCYFFTNKGQAIQIPVPEGRTVTGKFYKNVVLRKLKNYYKSRPPQTGLKYVPLLHDNAPAHKARIMTDFLESEKVAVSSAPSVFARHGPCDYFLFPKLKYHLSGRRYISINALESAVYQCLMGVTIERYENAFKNGLTS